MNYATALVTGLVLTLSMTTSALTVGVYGNGSAETNVGTGTSILQTHNEVSGSASLDASQKSGREATGTSAQDSNEGVADADIVSVTRADVEAAADGRAHATVNVPSAVHSKGDLSAYASSVVKNDVAISNTELTSAAVSLAYKQRAKLFGIIPIFLIATATVDANGQTTIDYPWYAFLVMKDSDSLKTDIETATATTVAANASANAQFSAAEQARLFAEMHNAMKSHLQASLVAEGSAGAHAK